MNDRRLDAIEERVGVSGAPKGSLCRGCGGLRIDHMLSAHHTLRGNPRMPEAEARAIMEEAAHAPDVCTKCGADTLAGCFKRHAPRIRERVAEMNAAAGQ